MSKKTDYNIEGYFDFVVPPLEGFWWQDGKVGVDYNNKEKFSWISIIRMPDFVKEKDLNWAKQIAEKKKKKDFSKVELLEYDEGLCVQCMHIGSYNDEPKTVESMHEYIEKEGYTRQGAKLRYNLDGYEKYLSSLGIYLVEKKKGKLEKIEEKLTELRKKVKLFNRQIAETEENTIYRVFFGQANINKNGYEKIKEMTESICSYLGMMKKKF